MKELIKKLVDFYLYSSIHIGLCCMFIYLFSIDRLGIPIDKMYAIFLIASTIFTYSIHRIIGMKKVSSFANKGRFAVIEKFKLHIIIYAIISLNVCVYTFLGFDMARQIFLLGAGLISILYTLPIFGGKKRLRDISFIKIFLIALVWSFVTETIPGLEHNINPSILILLYIGRIFYFIGITLPFDIRDIEVDQSNHVKTIPISIGKNKSVKLATAAILISILIETIVYFIYSTPALHSLILICTYFISIVLIHVTKNEKNDYYYSGLLDGTIMAPYIILWIINYFQ